MKRKPPFITDFEAVAYSLVLGFLFVVLILGIFVRVGG